MYYPVGRVPAADAADGLLNLIASRVGRAMRAVHGSEVAAETAGVDTGRYKLQVFVLSGAFVGLAGASTCYHASTSYATPSVSLLHPTGGDDGDRRDGRASGAPCLGRPR